MDKVFNLPTPLAKPARPHEGEKNFYFMAENVRKRRCMRRRGTSSLSLTLIQILLCES